MKELSEILRPSWGSEQWIQEGWNRITNEEKRLITARMDELFKDGLPFDLKENKLLYIYTFSMLAQLEVLAIQVPLKFEDKMSTPQFKEQLHTQLLDEIFHGMVFTKIVYLLCDPYSSPPAYNENIENLCNFIRKEECPKVAIMLLNLIGEGWIEEIFNSLQELTPKVFDVIITDEHRHVCEADLYLDIGMPDLNVVSAKLEYLEEQLLTSLFLQYKYVTSITSLIGIKGSIQFMHVLNEKHVSQLKKINLTPSKKWFFFVGMFQTIIPKIHEYSQSNYEIAMTPTRQALMTQWNDPSDPTMVGEFNLNVSPLDFFNKKYPSETITTLMLQTMSLCLSRYDTFRNFLSHKRLYQSREAYVAIVVQLPDCADHIGSILFKNCHAMSLPELAAKIRSVIQMMVFCFKKREELEQAHPHLKLINENILFEWANDVYGFPMPGSSFASLSNIGHCGYTQTKSPLRSNEAMKLTLLAVEKRLVWNKESGEFEAQDVLPVSVSADHRIFDGNLPIPKITTVVFDELLQQMINNPPKPVKPVALRQEPYLMELLDQVLINNLDYGYKILTLLQTIWPDFMELETLINPKIAMKAAALV